MTLTQALCIVLGFPVLCILGLVAHITYCGVKHGWRTKRGSRCPTCGRGR